LLPFLSESRTTNVATTQSAGAGGVEAHFLYPSTKPLFRAGIADSSTGPLSVIFHIFYSWTADRKTVHGSKNSPYASQFDEPGKPYAALVAATGCPTGPDSFQCLQKVPFEVNYLCWARYLI
jgi:hypothetical protein